MRIHQEDAVDDEFEEIQPEAEGYHGPFIDGKHHHVDSDIEKNLYISSSGPSSVGRSVGLVVYRGCCGATFDWHAVQRHRTASAGQMG